MLGAEVGINDPAGIALLSGMVEVATHPGTSILIVVEDFALEMGVGVALGLRADRLLIVVLTRVRLGDSGLYPVFALAGARLLTG